MSFGEIFIAGTLYGLLMRILFGWLPILNPLHENHANGPMLSSFVLLVPIIIGVYTVYLTPINERKISASIFKPWLPTLSFTAGTALLLIEGSICIAMALPIFLFMSSIGGLIGYCSLKLIKPKHGTMNAFLMLPLITGSFESNLPLPQRIEESTEIVYIESKPEVIWQYINHAEDIKPSEMSQGLAYKIGVPFPISANTIETPEGRIRKLQWAKNVKFDEPISDWDENRYIRWNYRFTAASFPKDALDEHVVIGGKYFDLVDTSYELTPIGSGTQLKIKVSYRVSTNFNFYSRFVGKILVDDAAKTILRFYKNRSEFKS